MFTMLHDLSAHLQKSKNHTHVKKVGGGGGGGGMAHLRITFWHLLVNLKNNY